MKNSKQIAVGNVLVGGGAPIAIQSMTTTKTSDVAATVRQIDRLTMAGCEIIRVAVPDKASALAIEQIKADTTIPIVADIHFDHTLALLAIERGVDKIRINPGNIGNAQKVRAVADAAKARNIPIRIGVNGGSLEPDIVQAHGHTPMAMAESALRHIALLNRWDFDNICLSVKSSTVADTIRAYRLLRERTSYPLHLGVTEAGTSYMGTIKNAIAIGSLLLDGIGDTLRVSLTDDPVEEIRAARAILQAIGLRQFGINLVSCPMCGRCEIDLITLAKEVEQKLAPITVPITVAVMGCAVNGPGEAKAADYGIACGKGEGLLFCKGQISHKMPLENLADALVDLIKKDVMSTT